MTNLDKRLGALEQIAVDIQRREMRELVLSLPEAADLTAAETEEAVDEAIRFLETLRCP